MKNKHLLAGISLWIAIALVLQAQPTRSATSATRNIKIQLAYDANIENTYQKTVNALSIANMFVSKLLKISYDPANDILSIPANEPACGDYPILPAIQNNGQQGVDVYIFVKQKASPTHANGAYCIFYQRPLFGYLEIDFDALEPMFSASNPKITENIVHLFLRQLFKILAFDRPLLEKYKSSDISIYVLTTNVGGKASGKVLNFPLVKAAAKKYFACDTLLGAPLEDNISSLSRWETTLLMEDLMSSTDIIITSNNIRLKFSALDAAIFQDLGFYSSVNTDLVEQMTYGYQRGCGFFQSGCQQYPAIQSSSIEFCLPNGTKGCNAWGTTKSSCNKIEQLNYCYTYSYPQTDGASPKCLASQLCFHQEDLSKDSSCSDAVVLISASNAIQILFSSTNPILSCTFDGQILVNADSSTIRCPDSIKSFADNLKLQSCQNSCSGNGICNNGICLCLSDYFGLDCATKIESQIADQFSYSIGLSDSVGSCPAGYKLSTTTTTQYLGTAVTLKQCVCSLTDGCELCHYAQLHSCYKCSTGYQLSSDTHECISCGLGCATCSLIGTVATCLTCNAGYYLDTDNGGCSTCEEKQYYDPSKPGCADCLLGCDTCIEKLKCSKCSLNNSYNVANDSPNSNNIEKKEGDLSFKRICYVDCGAGKTAMTKVTEDSFNVCNPCTDNSLNCSACHYDITNPLFLMICDKCINNFAQDLTKVDTPCTICADTFYLVTLPGSAKKCESCVQDHCLQCESPTKCTKCATGYFVKAGKCVASCGLGFYVNSNKVCTPCIEFCDVCENGTSCKVCSNSMQFDTGIADKTAGCLSSTVSCDSSCIRCVSSSGSTNLSQQCAACDVDLTLVPNYTFQQQSTAITGLITGQCRTHCFEDQREIPQDAYSSLNYKMCFYCDNSQICRKCTSTGGCSQCENENTHYLDTDTATCLPWAITCTSKESTLGCVECYNKNYFGYKNTCVKQCPEGYETGVLGDGKYCKKTTCNALCSTCIGPGYQDCVTCPKTRKLQAFHGSFSGTCECESDDLTDTNLPQCENSKDEQNFKVGSYTLAALSLTFTVVSSILVQSPMLFFFLADQSQSIGQLTYINDKHPYDVDDSMFCYKLFNLNILLPSPIVNEKLSQQSLEKSSSSKRLLESIDVSEYRGDLNRDKITDFHKSKDFVYAGFWALLIVILVWATKLCAHLLISKKQTKVVAWGSSFTPSKIYNHNGANGAQKQTPSKIYNIALQEEQQSSESTPEEEKQNKLLYVLNEYCAGLLPYIVFILTVSELSLLAFQNFHAQADKDTFTSFESFSIVVACLYIIAAATYILYLALQNKEGLIYSLFEEMRQGTMFFFLALVVKKITQSIFIVFLSNGASKQILAVVIIEAVFLFYIALVRPFRRETYFNLIFGIGEFLVFLIMVLYTAMSISESPSTQSGCAQAILVFSMVLMCHHLISGVFYVFKFHKFFVEWMRRRRQSVSKLEEKSSGNGKENAKQLQSQQKANKYLETPFGKHKNDTIIDPVTEKENPFSARQQAQNRQSGVFMEPINKYPETQGLGRSNKPQEMNSEPSNIFQTPFRQTNEGGDYQVKNNHPRDIFHTLGSPEEDVQERQMNTNIGLNNKQLMSPDQQYHKQGSKDLLLQ